MPINLKHIPAGKLSQEKIDEYREVFTRGWENYTYRELTEE